MDVEQVKYFVTSSVLVEVKTVFKVYYQTRQDQEFQAPPKIFEILATPKNIPNSVH